MGVSFYYQYNEQYSKGYVIMNVSVGKASQRRSIRLSVDNCLKTQWSKTKQRFKGSFENIFLKNQRLDYLHATITKRLNEIALEKDYDFDKFKEFVSDLVKTEGLAVVSKEEFFAIYDTYVESKEGKQLAPSTMTIYSTLRQNLQRYNDQVQRITFGTLNEGFYASFVDFLFTELEFKTNTVGKLIRTLKSFCHWAKERDFLKTNDYQNFKSFTAPTTINYLTDNELDLLANVSLEGDMDKVRDVFLFGCYTGQRVSDYGKVKKTDIVNNFWFNSQQKTKSFVKVPLSAKAKAILEKYKDEIVYALPQLDTQTINRKIKEIAFKAGITSKVNIVEYRGNTKLEKALPKCDIISSHDARRTFITLSLEKGMRPEVVMSITGHSDYNTFKKYIKITDKQATNEIEKFWN